jgi:hypothetical protein
LFFRKNTKMFRNAQYSGASFGESFVLPVFFVSPAKPNKASNSALCGRSTKSPA